jgi:hypothetical protein
LGYRQPLLPIWNRLPQRGQVIRAQLDTGEVLIGREIADKELDATLDRLEVGREKVNLTSQQAFDAVLHDNAVLTLANGWRIFPSRVAGETRVELSGPDWQAKPALDAVGVFRETHAYQMRWFIPVGNIAAMDKVTSGRPVIKVQKPRDAEPAPLAWDESDTAKTRLTDQPAVAAPALGQEVERIGKVLLGSSLTSPEWVAIRKAAEDDLALLVRRLAGDRAKVKAFDAMRDARSGGVVGGAHLRGLITVALTDMDGRQRDVEELRSVARHEVIHFLKESGVVPPGAWAALETAAPSWRKLFAIDER